MREPDGFGEFVAARSPALLRAAWLLTGNHATAQDLVQTALARTWPRWDQLDRVENAEAYVRRVMVTTYATWWRRRWRAEVATAEPPDRPAADDPFAAVDLRAEVRTALAGLPRRQRAVIVLRYFADLTEVQTAEALGCTVGTVKSQAAKALTRLRRYDWLAADDPATGNPTTGNPTTGDPATGDPAADHTAGRPTAAAAERRITAKHAAGEHEEAPR